MTESTLELPRSVNTEITISSIVPRTAKWNSKVGDANDSFRNFCRDPSIHFIDYSKSINPKKYSNNSKLHFNAKGSCKLRDHFVGLLERKYL